MKECYLYNQLDNEKCKCNACRYNCIISEGEVSRCGAKKNEKGNLYSLNYNYILAHREETTVNASAFIVPCENSVLALATYGCNFNCEWCFNKGIIRGGLLKKTGGPIYADCRYNIKSDKNLEKQYTHYTRYPGYAEPETLADHKYKIVGFNLSEPTVCLEYAYDTAAQVKKAGKYFELHTNGYMTREAWDLMAPVTDIVGISVKELGRSSFYKNNDIDKVFDSIICAAELGLKPTIFAVVASDEMPEQREKLFSIAAKYKLEIYFLALCYNHAFSSIDVPTSQQYLKVYQDALSRGVWCHATGLYWEKQGLSELVTVCPFCGEIVAMRKVETLPHSRVNLKFKTFKEVCNCGEIVPWRTIK